VSRSRLQASESSGFEVVGRPLRGLERSPPEPRRGGPCGRSGGSGSVSGIRIQATSWADEVDREAMIDIRYEVFVVEQEVPVELELDSQDPACRHLLAFEPNGHPIGTARMQPDGHIGRIAVVEAWRKQGTGTRLVAALVEAAREVGLNSVDLDSQVHAVGFYEKLGFETCGDVFMEAGIPHQNMRLRLV